MLINHWTLCPKIMKRLGFFRITHHSICSKICRISTLTQFNCRCRTRTPWNSKRAIWASRGSPSSNSLMPTLLSPILSTSHMRCSRCSRQPIWKTETKTKTCQLHKSGKSTKTRLCYLSLKISKKMIWTHRSTRNRSQLISSKASWKARGSLHNRGYPNTRGHSSQARTCLDRPQNQVTLNIPTHAQDPGLGLLEG